MYNRKQVFIAACIGLLLFGIMLITLGSILPSLSAKFQMDKIQSAKLSSLLFIGIIAGSFVFGPITDRYGHKMLLLVSTLLIIVTFEGLAFTESFFLLQTSIFFLGFSGGIINGATNALVADISTEDKEAHLSLLGVFFGIGALGMPLLLGILSKKFDYPVILSSVGLLMLLAIFYFITIKFPIPKHKKGLPLIEVFKLLIQPSLLLTSVFLFFQSGAENLINTWTTTYLQSDLKVSKENSLFALSCYVGGLTVGRLLLGKLLKSVSSFKMMLLSLLLAAAGGFLLYNSSSSWLILTSFIIIGFGFAASFPVILGYIGQIYAKFSGTAFSIAFVIALIGSTLINFLFGIVSNAWGTKQFPVLLLSIIGCLIILILLIRQNLSSKIKM